VCGVSECVIFSDRRAISYTLYGGGEQVLVLVARRCTEASLSAHVADRHSMSRRIRKGCCQTLSYSDSDGMRTCERRLQVEMRSLENTGSTAL